MQANFVLRLKSFCHGSESPSPPSLPSSPKRLGRRQYLTIELPCRNSTPLMRLRDFFGSWVLVDWKVKSADYKTNEPSFMLNY